MKLLQNSWSELLMLNILYLQTCHDRCDVLLVVSNHTDLHPGCCRSKNSSSLFFYPSVLCRRRSCVGKGVRPVGVLMLVI